MNRKRKGTAAEREIIRMFWQTGEWAAHRIAGSGSVFYPSPDIIAGKKDRKIAIEAKITKSAIKYFQKKEIQELIEFSVIFGAEPWVAVKFGSESWIFVSAYDLDETEKGMKISLEKSKLKGLIFEELIS